MTPPARRARRRRRRRPASAPASWRRPLVRRGGGAGTRDDRPGPRCRARAAARDPVDASGFARAAADAAATGAVAADGERRARRGAGRHERRIGIAPVAAVKSGRLGVSFSEKSASGPSGFGAVLDRQVVPRGSIQREREIVAAIAAAIAAIEADVLALGAFHFGGRRRAGSRAPVEQLLLDPRAQIVGLRPQRIAGPDRLERGQRVAQPAVPGPGARARERDFGGRRHRQRRSGRRRRGRRWRASGAPRQHARRAPRDHHQHAGGEADRQHQQQRRGADTAALGSGARPAAPAAACSARHAAPSSPDAERRRRRRQPLEPIQHRQRLVGPGAALDRGRQQPARVVGIAALERRGAGLQQLFALRAGARRSRRARARCRRGPARGCDRGTGRASRR